MELITEEHVQHKSHRYIMGEHKQRYRSEVSGTSGRTTISNRLNTTQLKGSRSGKIDCVVHCIVDIPGEEQFSS